MSLFQNSEIQSAASSIPLSTVSVTSLSPSDVQPECQDLNVSNGYSYILSTLQNNNKVIQDTCLYMNRIFDKLK